MAHLYDSNSMPLREIVERAASKEGATLLIPDLQRPYVWTPNQVILLVDSLLRGWPFGTLLLWNLPHQRRAEIPGRTFWTKVDRTLGGVGAVATQMNPPASYYMVLDGQQRIQSLLLALGGDDSGFILEDREWHEELSERRPRGRQTRHRHWSKASLCLDLGAFVKEYGESNHTLEAVDFRTILRWVITDPQNGQSSFLRQDNYQSPLPRAFEPNSEPRYLRLSRFWDVAVSAPPEAKESYFRNIVGKLLQDHTIRPDLTEKLLPAMGEFMTTLASTAREKVTFIELAAHEKCAGPEDAYNDAIVSIFTRLNTAGRSLTREEITLAWLKSAWQADKTGGLSAGDCFQRLGADLADQGITLDTDNLVGAVSVIWAIAFNHGRLLANRDLLKGDVIRPMADAVSSEWLLITNACTLGSEILHQRSLEYGPRGQISSLNALAILWAWIYLAERWKSTAKLNEFERDDFSKRVERSIAECVDQWVLCSQWARVWSSSSNVAVEEYARKLAHTHREMGLLAQLSDAHQQWEQCFTGLIGSIQDAAIGMINSLQASSRDRVSIYRTPLWLWHRLDPERWKYSQIQLRVGKRRPSIDVDHVVAHKLWERLFSAGMEVPDGDTYDLVNSLGNCALLEKNFNISKSDNDFLSFLSKVHEVRGNHGAGEFTMESWCSSLVIDQAMLTPKEFSREMLIDAVKRRDRKIREEIAEFITGKRRRSDVEASAAPPETRGKRAFSMPHGSRLPPVPVASANAATVNIAADPGPLAAIDLVAMRAACDQNPALRIVVVDLVQRHAREAVTHLNALITSLKDGGNDLPRATVIQCLRRLEGFGAGRFVKGVRGHESRMKWNAGFPSALKGVVDPGGRAAQAGHD